MSVPRTPGGKRLRALREFYRKTQLEIELDASLGTGYLQRLELGKVQQPERETLERILAALNAHYSERREILELFGYLVDAPLPTADEMAWAVAACQAELDSAVFPAYVLDCAHRLLYGNKIVSRVFNTHFENVSMLKMVFDCELGMSTNIQNKDVFFPAQIRAFRYEMQRFDDEAWYKTLLEDMLECHNFERYWTREKYAPIHIPARPLTPLEIDIAGKGILKFRLISEPFVQDHRFRVLFYLPADARTSQQCLDWFHESEEPQGEAKSMRQAG
ncbi:helix-turn-helix domain-containing protein [Oscillatoria laete-virens NRMC-F 0139]|nr:helix-turn-helix domain-containing protein [Oscillatoria laete-virens]MDL5054607.1 helix-turn-helix domain-containing protein [Oscillatoria laete-virens NRMC-F 0139]